MGRAPDQFKEIERRRDKAERDADAPDNALPAGDPVGLWQGGL
jgi:hypothetical protein